MHLHLYTVGVRCIARCTMHHAPCTFSAKVHELETSKRCTMYQVQSRETGVHRASGVCLTPFHFFSHYPTFAPWPALLAFYSLLLYMRLWCKPNPQSAKRQPHRLGATPIFFFVIQNWRSTQTVWWWGCAKEKRYGVVHLFSPKKDVKKVRGWLAKLPYASAVQRYGGNT